MENFHYTTLKKLVHKVHKIQSMHKLFAEGDKILVGVSGGKDSLLLLEILGELHKHYKYNFEIIPVHIRIKDIGYHIDFEAIKEISNSYNFNFQVIESSIDFDPDHKKGPCFVCSWHRRKLLFSMAKEKGCNKIALGHHMDDAVQTLLMNMIYHGSISSMPARLSMFGGTLELIRPLLFVNEKDIIKYEKERNFPLLVKDCPYGQATQRNKMKEVIASLEDIHPHAKQNLFRAMSKIFTSYLPEGEKSIIAGLNEIHPPTRKTPMLQEYRTENRPNEIPHQEYDLR